MNKKTKIYILSIGAILCLGLVSYALVLYYANKNFTPIKIMMDSSLMDQRLYLRNLAETIYSICLSIYILGQILLIIFILKNEYRLFVKDLFGYVILQIIFAFISVLPFAIFDLSHFGDYIFPIRSFAIKILGLYMISYIILVSKKQFKK